MISDLSIWPKIANKTANSCLIVSLPQVEKNWTFSNNIWCRVLQSTAGQSREGQPCLNWSGRASFREEARLHTITKPQRDTLPCILPTVVSKVWLRSSPQEAAVLIPLFYRGATRINRNEGSYRRTWALKRRGQHSASCVSLMLRYGHANSGIRPSPTETKLPSKNSTQNKDADFLLCFYYFHAVGIRGALYPR